MSLQFKRGAKVEIFNDSETLTVEGLRIKFEVVRTSLGYPNRGKIQIYNLSEAKIQQITQRLSKVRLFAGYNGEIPQVYEADLINFYKTRLGVDSVFELVTGSGKRSWTSSQFSKTYNAGVAIETIIKEVVESFIDVIPGVVVLPPDLPTKLQPLSLSGSSSSVMDILARDYNFDWNIDQNVLDVVGRGLSSDDKTVFNINPQTGLIGAPTLTELGADFRILLNPEILVGREVFMDSTTVQLAQAATDIRKVRTTADGFYKVKETRLIGDTRGQDWYTDIIGWRVADEPRKDSN